MDKKMLKVLPLMVGGLALGAALTACSSSEGVESVEARSGRQLQQLLLTASESGVDGLTETNDTVLDGEAIPLVVIAGAERFDGACGDALQAAEAAELPTIGSAARNLVRSDNTGVAVAQFSVDDTDISPAKLYEDIAESCTDPVRDAETGAEYSFTPLESDAAGFIFDITVTPGNESTSVMMLKDLGHHHIVVAGIDADEADVRTVFNAQVEKTEAGLAPIDG